MREACPYHSQGKAHNTGRLDPTVDNSMGFVGLIVLQAVKNWETRERKREWYIKTEVDG